MFKKICLLVCCAVLLWVPKAQAQADADPYFVNYLDAVAGLNLDKTEDGQKAAKAFIVYMQEVIKNKQELLFRHLDDTVLVGDTALKKNTVIKDAKKIFNEVVVQAVRQADPKEEVFVRNMVEYMVGSGCLWFTFTDDKANQPVIFAINNAE